MGNELSCKINRWTRFACLLIVVIVCVMPSEHVQPFVEQIKSRIFVCLFLLSIFIAGWQSQVLIIGDRLETRFGRWVIRGRSPRLEEISVVSGHQFLRYHLCYVDTRQGAPEWTSDRYGYKNGRVILQNLFTTGYKDVVSRIVACVRPGTSVEDGVLESIGFTRADIGKDYQGKAAVIVEQETKPSVPSVDPLQHKRPRSLTILCILGLARAIVIVSGLFMTPVRQAVIHEYGLWFVPFTGLTALTGLIGLIGIWRMRKWGVYVFAAAGVVLGIFALGDDKSNLAQFILPLLIIGAGIQNLKRMR